MGLLHIGHQHQRPGQYTIRQVVQDERTREINRQRLTHKATPDEPEQIHLSTADSIRGTAIGTLVIALFVLGAILSNKVSVAARKQRDEAVKVIADDILAEISTTGLKTVPAPINLADGEHCYFAERCTFAMMQNVDTGSNSVGFSFRIAPGVRLGTSYRLPREKLLKMTKEDSGNLYLTNKHLIFVGSTTSQSFTWSRILKITPYFDGARYEISNHRPIQFRTGDARAAILSRVLIDGLPKPRQTSLTEQVGHQ